MPEWLKSTTAIFIFIVFWDIIRMPIQAWVTRKFLKQEFDEIDEALDDVEEAIEEDNELDKDSIKKEFDKIPDQWITKG